MGGTRYSLHPSYEHLAAVIANLPTTTGRSLDEWTALVAARGPAGERERRGWLKAEHGLGLATIGAILDGMQGTAGPESYGPDGFVAAMFADRKGLLPAYERLLALGLALGDDVKACPCATIVPLYRRHVFAQLKPTTKSRLDLGLALGDAPAGGRLVGTGGLARRDRITHRVAIARPADIDAEVERLLRAAYLRDG